MRMRKEQVSALACALFNKHTDIDECIAIANKYIQEAEERARAEICQKIDSQVCLAAQQVTPEQREFPEWIWLNARTGEQSLGRWPKASGVFAAYIRLDLVMESGNG